MTAFDKAWELVKEDEPDYDAIKEGLEATLIDDGTLDTVIDVNGREYRFSYDPEMGDGGDDFLDEIESTVNDGEQSYDAFVAQCLDDAKEEYIMEMVENDGKTPDPMGPQKKQPEYRLHIDPATGMPSYRRV